MRAHSLLLASTLLLGACGRAPSTSTTTSLVPTADAGPVADASSPSSSPSPSLSPAPPSCEELLAARALPAPSPRQVAYTDRLPEVLVRTQVDPVLFLRWPDAAPRSARATAFRVELDHAAHPTRALRQFLVAHPDRGLRREVLLSDGYLFSDRPALAVALSAELELSDLFEGARVYRARDGVVDALDREGDHYVEVDGSVATLRPNDRVSEDDASLADPLGLDLEVVRETTGALRTIPTALGEDAAALDLVFPDGSRRPALVALEAGRTEVVCVGGPSETLAATRQDADRFWTRHRALVAAAEALVDESPRFDEPTDEPEGVQQDGQLRLAWVAAYERGDDTFTYGTVEYPVFDGEGRPVPPEVCIDFVFDAWQRGGGTWYRGAAEARGRTHGVVDLGPANLPRRSLSLLLDSADAEGAVLDRFDVSAEDRVSLSRGAAYAHAIARTADAFREGDALVVYGLRLQDMAYHHHALLVIRTEPVTGVPMLVADNQGRPQFRTLSNAMQAAPLRAIAHRLRLDVDALAAVSGR